MTDQPMQLTTEEREKLQNSKDEKAWYRVCDEIKDRRNGQFPNYLAREVLELFQHQFPVTLS